MTSDPSTTPPELLPGHTAWLNELVYRLRLQGASPEAIGDILLEADAHVRDTGETPEDAFGPAKSYATSRAVGTRPVRLTDRPQLLEIIGALAGVALTVWSMWLLVNDGHLPFMLRPWVGLALGLAILWLVLRPARRDLVRNPVSGHVIGDSQLTRDLRMHFGMVAFVVILYMVTVVVAAFV
jgi:hypothetical protein